MPITHAKVAVTADDPSKEVGSGEWNEAHVGSFPQIYTPGGTILSPSAAITLIVWRVPNACTVTAVRGYRVGGTGAVINAKRAGLSLLSADLSLTAADAWTAGAGLQNTIAVAGDKIEIVIVSTTGGPSQVAIQVDMTT